MKTKFFKISMLVLMVAALIATFTSNSFAQRYESRSNDLLMDSLKHEIGIPNLTADQKTKMENLRVNHLKEITPLRNEMTEKKAHLKTLESAEKPDKAAINKTIDEISVLHGKIMKASVNHRLEVASILTDEQKVFFNAHQGKMKKSFKDHGMGNGRGDGMSKGMRKGMNSDCPNCPNKK